MLEGILAALCALLVIGIAYQDHLLEEYRQHCIRNQEAYRYDLLVFAEWVPRAYEIVHESESMAAEIEGIELTEARMARALVQAWDEVSA